MPTIAPESPKLASQIEHAFVAQIPQLAYETRLAPDGSILSKRLTKSSGNGAYDEAVMRAVERSDPLPRDTNGKAPSSVNLTFRPKE